MRLDGGNKQGGGRGSGVHVHYAQTVRARLVRRHRARAVAAAVVYSVHMSKQSGGKRCQTPPPAAP